MVKCSVCGIDEMLPFRCSYCGLSFCAEHRLPEKHGCMGIMRTKSPEETRIRTTLRYSGKQPKSASVFSGYELVHLTGASAVVCVAGFGLIGFSVPSPSIVFLLVGGFAASFIGHELAHKFVALQRGLAARFRIFPAGLFVTLLTAFLPVPFKVIMPGAVLVSGFTTQKTLGEVAAAGPLFNFVTAIILFILAKLLTNPLFETVATVNSFLMFFNLLPIPPLDGDKVFSWSWRGWGLLFGLSLGLMTVLQLL